MLCEISLARTMMNDLETLVNTALSVGKDGVSKFELPAFTNGPKDGEDGI